MKRRIVLVGPSGTGKTTTAKAVGAILGWDVADTDHQIEAREGRTIPDIFASDGEAAFRAIERDVFGQALARDEVVIATGGGAPANDAAWSPDLLGSDETLTIHLDAPPAALVERLQRQAALDGAGAMRPLLQGDAIATLSQHRVTRQQYYGRADVALGVDGRAAANVAADIVELANLANGVPSQLDLVSTSAPSTITVGPGTRRRTGEIVAAQWPWATRIWLCVDEHVAAHLGERLAEDLGLAAFDVRPVVVPAGESSKSVAGLSRLWDAMLDGGAERSDVLIAVGGGVVGDLAGFAAATVLRGIGLVQIPTTLLSMVDSSVGGKTGINHATGKNLIGAFYQPRRVIVDTELLATLPEREFRSGFSEIIKHGVIEGSTPGEESGVVLDVLGRNADALLARRSPVLPWAIRRNIAIKAAVVEADEREANLRAILNFGHTMGHGIEAAGFRMLHGEAVAIGMVGALRLSEAVHGADPAHVAAIVSLIERHGLPQQAEVDPERVVDLMGHDKKKAGGKQLWVLLNGEGRVDIVRNVAEPAIAAALATIVSPRASTHGMRA
ncbi:MAG: 3-dehydroquinate synthase [Thermomicrobiales bacterium]